ncbi:MAG TPA: CoA transferase, partial [Ilumatobacteraceae bacterium]|nr:CoA transferase [Ilumatobacteraceae bacterium]
PPIGDTMRTLPDPFEACQRGKRSITVDLRTDEGRAAVYQLVADADIVVHNMRPGKADKLGVGYEALRAIKPDLIYVFQPGWGSTGPWSQHKSFAPLVSAMTGLMVAAAGEGNPPVPRARASEDYYGGFLGAAATLMAVRHRDRTGQGQYIESPQFHASLFVVSEHMQDTDGNLLRSMTLDPEQLGIHPLYRLFQASDGWVGVAAVGDSAHRRLRDEIGLDDASTPAATAAALTAVAAASTVDELVARLERAHIACEVALEVPRMPDFFWEDWALDNQYVFEHHDHGTWGYMREVGLTIRLSRTPGRNAGPGPLLGEHNDEILGSLQS